MNDLRTPLKPLDNTTILVTRSAGQSSQFSQLLEAEGATVMEMPTLVIHPPSTWEPLDQAIAQLQMFDWLILTSANGVEFFFQRLFQQGKTISHLATVKIAVVGKKTAATLKKQGLKPDLIPTNFVADSLVEDFPESLNQKRILFPRVETGGREILVQELTAKAAKVVEVPAYESGCPETIDPDVIAALQQQKIDIITFASSKTVKNFYRLIQSFQVNLDQVCIASIGPQTSESCQEYFGRYDIQATEYTLEGLTAAIIDWKHRSPMLSESELK
jgi:uroporphyrinogen III methyltransferase/synthase